MTSDAKIGLLLGLVFIFIIAFIINGLPSFRRDANNNELTTNMVSLQNDSLGLAAKERGVRKIFNQAGQPEQQHRPTVQTPPTNDEGIRFTTPLPKSPSVVEEPVAVKPVAPAPKPVAHTPKNYVVCEGDSLAVIAKKFYGSDKGNKRVNITRIFEANRRFLKSPDEIYVGQKLKIPPLTASASKSKIERVFGSKMFKSIKSIGRKRFSTDAGRTKRSGQYVVRQDDSLWRIAAEQLGNGSRYGEIARLNADILEDEDNLPVGMRLKLPVR
jgi:nucleoid-associated protein YgaU